MDDERFPKGSDPEYIASFISFVSEKTGLAADVVVMCLTQYYAFQAAWHEHETQKLKMIPKDGRKVVTGIGR